VLATKFVSMK